MSGAEFIGSSEVFRANLLNIKTKSSGNSASGNSVTLNGKGIPGQVEFASIIESVMSPSTKQSPQAQPDHTAPTPLTKLVKEKSVTSNPHHNKNGRMLDKIMEMQAASRVAKIQSGPRSGPAPSAVARKAYSKHFAG